MCCGRRSHEHGGVEVDTQGDAFFVAFARASDAVAAASDGQAALRGGPISVRMGLHTGEPVVTDEGYVGIDVHRAARIAAAGHGGQVLLSQATRDLVAGEAVRDLGEHRLKDLSAPERLFQLGDADFPRLKTLYQTNLPVPATPFLGRERELDEVVGLLRREDVRLLTLTGPGGTGKTRLALQAAAEVAEDAPDGVWWISLAALRDPALALDAVAKALDVRERPGFTVEETLVDALAAKRALLLIDNAEHLLPQVASEIARLRELGGPKLLVTSRERLQLQGEHAWSVPSLDDHDGHGLVHGAGAGVCDRRSRRRRRSPSSARASTTSRSRSSSLPPASRSSRRSSCSNGSGMVSSSGAGATSTHASRPWTRRSAGRTTSSRRKSGGCSRGLQCSWAAARTRRPRRVCAADADTLQSLIDKSLVRSREAAGGDRYWMLETIREFAAAELEASGEAAALRRQHANFFTAFTERADPHLRHGPDQQRWVERVAADYDNVRAAMSFALEHDLTLALRVVGRTRVLRLASGRLRRGAGVARRDPAARGWSAAGPARRGARVRRRDRRPPRRHRRPGSTFRRGLRRVRRGGG